MVQENNYQIERSYSPRLVLVEDERIVARDIETILEGLGYSIVANVGSGEEAVEEVTKLKPDLLLMDIRLSGNMDGIEAVTEINKSCDCPVIYLSAYSDDQTMLRARSTSPFGYLVKPFNSPELRCAIEIALHKHKMEASLRQQKQWFSSTLRSVGDGVIATDIEKKITFVNPVAENLTGWEKENAVGQIIEDIFQIVDEDTRENQPETDSGEAKFPNERPNNNILKQAYLIAKPGTRVPIEHTSAKVVDEKGQLLGGVMTFRDITERKKNIDAIKRLNSSLEQKIKDRTTQLEAANKELEFFSYSVAHDLRAPIRAIVGYSKILVEENNHLDMASLQTLDKIQSATSRMSRLIEDLLRLAGITRMNINHRSINLSSIVNEIAASLKTEFPDHPVDFIFEDNISIQCDGQLLKIAIENLLRNSWKFTRNRDNPKIEFGTTYKDNSRVFYIRDNGVGFNMEYAEKLFTPFQRFHSTSEFEGTGIGLAIVHRIISRHNGQIWADSSVGKGTTFYFTLMGQNQVDSTANT